MSEKKIIKINDEIKTSEEVIIIKNLSLNAVFGYYKHEKVSEQELIFNLKLFINENIYQDNNLDEILDYDKIIQIIKNSRQSESHFKKQYQNTLLKKQVNKKEIFSACKFFIENQSITGQSIAVDSGQSLNWQTKDLINVHE